MLYRLEALEPSGEKHIICSCTKSCINFNANYYRKKGYRVSVKLLYDTYDSMRRKEKRKLDKPKLCGYK